MKSGDAAEVSDGAVGGTVKVRLASRYGRNSSSADEDVVGDEGKGNTMLIISEMGKNRQCFILAVSHSDLHFPRGVDILLSPTTKTCAAAVEDPLPRLAGGNTSRAVSTS